MCLVKNCLSRIAFKGYCRHHYDSFRKYGDPLKAKYFKFNCDVPNCDQKHFAKGFCKKHYGRLKRGNDPYRIFKYRKYDRRGYVMIKPLTPHPNAYVKAHGWILEHRFVMSNYLGRTLDKDEVVHHINGVRDDNRI